MAIDAPGVEVELARIAAEFPGLPIFFVDDVTAPSDDGDWTRLAVSCQGEPRAIIIFKTTRFYTSLNKVMKAALPKLGDSLMN